MPVDPFAVVAEVMDKEPSAALIWFTAVLLAVGGFAAARYRPKALILIVPICLVAVLAVLAELRDPFVGTAMSAEAGTPFVPGTYLAILLVLLAPIIGLWARHRERSA